MVEIKKFLIIVFSFYFLVLFQMSFLTRFSFVGAIPVVFIIVLFLIFFESIKPQEEGGLGIAAAVSAGFFLDIFSAQFIGSYILLLLGLAIFIKMIMRKYVQIPKVRGI